MSGFSRGGNFKADVPHKTIVVDIPKRDIDRLRTLIAAYETEMPQELSVFMRIISVKLGQSNGN